MFALDLFNTKYEQELNEGAVDNLTARLIEPLSQRAAEIRTRLRNGNLTGSEIKALEQEYANLVAKRVDIIRGRAPNPEFEKHTPKKNEFDITEPQDECMGYGGLGEAGLPDVADKATKMAQLNQPNKVGTDLATAQQRVNPNPNKGVVGHAVDWLRGRGGPGREGPTYEDLDEQATPGSTAQGVYNEMIQAWTDEKDHLVIPFPNSPNATLTRPQLWNALVTLGQVAPNRRAKYIESKFNDFETFMRWLNQIKRYKVPAKKKKNVQQAMDLQPQVVAPPSVAQAAEPQVPMAENRGQKKNSEEPDLTGSTARDATVQRELQKVRARHPSARTDIEALVKDEIVNQERVNQEIEHLETVDSQQDAQLKQALTLNRQQEQEITGLNRELSRLDSKLNQVMATTAATPTTQPTQTATTTKATPATATPLSVTPATTEPVKPAEPVADKSAAEIARLEKQIQQLELMMTLRTPVQQDDLRDRIDALEKERDAKIEKQQAATAKGAATRKANKDKAAVAVASEKPSTAPTTVEPEKTQKPYYPDTAGIAGMGGSTKAKPNKPTGMDFLDNLLKGHKIEVDPGETAELDPEELRQTAEVDESADNPLDAGAGRQLSRTPEIRRLRQQKDYEIMLKKELANRIQDRDESDDEQDFQDVTESNMKRLEDNLAKMSDEEFQTRYGKNKAYWRNRIRANLAPATNTNINDLESDIDTDQTRPSFDRAGRVVRQKPANTQQGMKRMLGTPKSVRPAPELEPVSVTMQVPNRKTDRYDLLPARIFNSEAEAREFARRVNGNITSIRPVMHEDSTQNQRLHAGDPVVVTAPNEFEGATGEIYDFAPSGKFVIVDLYNHGKHSMHLSDVEYNQYADNEDEIDESQSLDIATKEFIDQINDRTGPVYKAYYRSYPKGATLQAKLAQQIANKYGVSVKDLESAELQDRARQLHGVKEGFQDFNKVEPYAVCLAGKPVKQFDYYEDARRFHDNWKKKLYREGNKAKADKITLMPIMDEGWKSALAGAALAGATALGAPAAHSAPVQAGALQQSLSQQLKKPVLPQPQIPKEKEKSDDNKEKTTVSQTDVKEAGSPAQQAAIAIAMKKAGKKPKQADEAYTPSPAKPFRNPRGFNKQGTGIGNRLAQQTRAELANIQPSKGTPVPAKEFAQGVLKDLKKVNVKEAEGSWIVYDPETKQIKKRFKTHTAGKSYAQTHKLGFASSEYYFDNVKGQQSVTETVTDVKAEMARVYRKLAPKIERHRDSFLAGQLYDELENIAELHGAETEFKRMLAGARNRAHMDYDTNPGGFQNWFWYLPFEDQVDEGLMKDPTNRKEYLDQRDKLFRMLSVESDLASKQIIKQAIKDLDARFGSAKDPIKEESSTSSEAVEIAVIRRVLVAHTDLIMEFGLDKVTQAIEEVAYTVGDVDEIGSSDVSAWVNQVKQILGVEA